MMIPLRASSGRSSTFRVPVTGSWHFPTMQVVASLCRADLPAKTYLLHGPVCLLISGVVVDRKNPGGRADRCRSDLAARNERSTRIRFLPSATRTLTREKDQRASFRGRMYQWTPCRASHASALALWTVAALWIDANLLHVHPPDPLFYLIRLEVKIPLTPNPCPLSIAEQPTPASNSASSREKKTGG